MNPCDLNVKQEYWWVISWNEWALEDEAYRSFFKKKVAFYKAEIISNTIPQGEVYIVLYRLHALVDLCRWTHNGSSSQR